MFTEIFNWIKNNLTLTQALCFVIGILMLSLAVGINAKELISGEWHAGMLTAQDWVFFGFGILFLLIAVFKNGTKKRHNDIIQRLERLEKLCRK